MHTLDPWGGVKVVTFFVAENGHVAYQINGKDGHAHTMVILTMDGLGGVGREIFFNPVGDRTLFEMSHN